MLNYVIKIFDCHVIQLECASTSIYVAQNAPKMHASYLLFEVNLIALANTSILLLHVNQSNSNVQCFHEIETFFFRLGCL